MESRTGCRMSITILLLRNNNRVVGSDAVLPPHLKYATSCSVGKITIYLISASGHIREAAAIAIDFHHYAVRWSCDRDLFLRVPSGSWSQSIFSKHTGSRGLEWLLGSYFVIYLVLHNNNYFGPFTSSTKFLLSLKNSVNLLSLLFTRLFG